MAASYPYFGYGYVSFALLAWTIVKPKRRSLNVVPYTNHAHDGFQQKVSFPLTKNFVKKTKGYLNKTRLALVEASVAQTSESCHISYTSHNH